MPKPILCDTSDMRLPHGAFRDTFGAATAVLQTVDDGSSRAGAVACFYGMVIEFLQCHHGAEDAILWPLLRERAVDHASLLDRMEAQHAGVEEMCAAARRAVTAYATEPSSHTRDGLATAVRALLAELDAHLAEEEAEILPLAAVTVTQDEWGSMPGWAMQHFEGPNWLIVGLVLEQMTSTQAETFLNHVPAALSDMWRTGGAKEFEALTALVRGGVEAVRQRA